MLPPAPGRLSTTTGCPQVSPSCLPSARDRRSAAPTGGNGTTMCTAFPGEDCAPASAGAAPPAGPGALGGGGRQEGGEVNAQTRGHALVPREKSREESLG